MITHAILIRLSDAGQSTAVAEKLRGFAEIEAVRHIIVAENLGLAPGRWDLCTITQHRDVDELNEYLADQRHKDISASISHLVADSAIVDLDVGGALSIS